MELPAQPTWLGPFKGAEHSFLDCEAIALQHLDPSWREQQWAAHETIWFDYVRVHPIKAFYYFCDCYSFSFGEYLGSNINHELRYSRGLKGDPILHREKRSLLAIKQAADREGIPYPFWLRHCFAWFALSGWTRPPRPAHLASSKDAQQYAIEKWAETCTSMSVYPKDPWFRSENFCGHPQQIRAEDWTVQSIRMRPLPDVAIASAIYETQTLRIERAMVEFPKHINYALDWHNRINQISQR